MDQKIFNIGLKKTGTTSLNQALLILGYRSIHRHKINNLAIQSLRETGHSDWISNYDAFAEAGGFNRHWRLLIDSYPDALFLFTTRPLEEWLTSLAVNNLCDRLNGDERKTINMDQWANFYKQHHEETLKFFGARAIFCRLDLCGTDGWEQLCTFLGRPLPKVPFPHKHKSHDKLAECLQALRKKES